MEPETEPASDEDPVWVVPPPPPRPRIYQMGALALALAAAVAIAMDADTAALALVLSSAAVNVASLMFEGNAAIRNVLTRQEMEARREAARG